MKNKFHAFLYFTATVLLLLNISSCSGIASPSEQESPSASRGFSLRGTFSLAEASAVPSEYQTATNAALQASRNAIPDTSTLTYSVSATNASNGNEVWATNANSTSYEFNGNLTAGTWEITAYAKQDTAVVLQSEPKTVTLSKLAMDASASLTMAPSTSGSGSINLPVSWASGSGIGYCNYSKPDGITITTTSGQPDKITAESIEAGIYTVTLSFYTSEDNYNSGAAPLYKCEEYLAVYPELETNTWTKETAPHIDASGNFNVTKSCVETFVYRKIYVEQGASSSNANGTSERPYPSIESAMTRLSEVAGAGIITGISATNPWELHVKGTLKAPSGIGQNFINVPSSVGHLKIVGEGSGATIDADSKCRVLNVASGANVTVENITLKNGSATTGGGVCVASGGTFTMQSGTISSCYASGAGGGIYSEGTLSIQGGYINSNNVTAGTGTGGGIQVAGGSVSIAATGVTIKSNSCGGNGKNIYISSSATATIPTGDSAIYDDSTGTGGKADAVCYASSNNFARFNKAHSTQNAIDSVISQFTGDATIYLGMTTSGDTSWNSTTDIASACTQNLTIRPTKTGTKATIKYSASAETTDYLIRFNKSGKTLTLTNLILDGNSKKCGIAKLEAGTLTATNCTFQYGKARDGGGLYVNNGTEATLSSCTVQYCNAEKDNGTNVAYGGGIYTRGVVTFSGTIQNCSTKGVGGGAVVEATTGASLTMTDGTITSCNAEVSGSIGGQGGGVYTYWTFSMEGGTITGCTSERNGAGVFLGRANSSTPVLEMKGNAKITTDNEVYISGNYNVKITGNLNATVAAKIRPSTYSTTTQVLTDDSSGTLVGANYHRFRLTDSSNYSINDSGYLENVPTLYATSDSTGTELYDYLQTYNNFKLNIPSGVTYKIVPHSSYSNSGNFSGNGRNCAIIIPSGKTLTLCGSGTLSLSAYSGNIIEVNGGTLNLTDSVTIDPSTNGIHWRAVGVSNGGAFNMSGGTITGVSSGGGGGIVTVWSGCTFTMTGGSITGNMTAHGGIDVSGGTFTMTGGSITNNHPTSSNNYAGGVSITSGGTFTKSGGTITDNTNNTGVTANVMIVNYGTYNGTTYGSSSSPVDRQILY
ncbi:MAG: hypothetical protein J6P28_02605 [Treponema sp.]|nr:hypothetical protein [Treponema sp.]